MNADAHLEDTRMPKEYPEDIFDDYEEEGFYEKIFDDYMIEVMYGGKIDWDAEEW
jgi:hypothetical protein